MGSNSSKSLDDENLLSTLYCMERSFGEINLDYERIQKLESEEISKKVDEYIIAEQEIQKIRDNYWALFWSYKNKIKNAVPSFGKYYNLYFVGGGGFVTFFLLKPWNWVLDAGLSWMIIVTIVIWIAFSGLFTGLIMLPLANVIGYFKKRYLEYKMENELEDLERKNVKDIERVRIKYPIFGLYRSFQEIYDSYREDRINNKYYLLKNEVKNKKRRIADEYDEVFPSVLYNTVSQAIRWIENGDVKTKSELLDKAWDLHQTQEINHARLRFEEADKSFKQTTLYKREKQMEQSLYSPIEGKELKNNSFEANRHEELKEIELQKNIETQRKKGEEINKQNEENQRFWAIHADNARRTGEDREKVKELDRLAGRDLKNRVDADHNLGYREKDTNSERGGSYGGGIF